MKKIYDYKCLVSINEEPFEETSICRHLCLKDEKYVKTETCSSLIENFDEVVELIEDGFIPNANVVLSNDRKKSQITFSFPQSIRHEKYSEKNFKSFKVKFVYEEVKPTMKELMEELNAYDFCEFLKSRGVGFTKF